MTATLQPHTTTTATPPIDNALLACSALAWKGNPLAGLDHHADYHRDLVTTTLATHTPAQILNWHTTTNPNSLDLNWLWARRMVRQHLSDTPGAHDLPLRYQPPTS